MGKLSDPSKSKNAIQAGHSEKAASSKGQQVELNTIIHKHEACMPIDDPISVWPLSELSGPLNKTLMRIVKDDEPNINVVSQRVIDQSRNCFDPGKGNCHIQYSRNRLTETCLELVLLGKLKFEAYRHVKFDCLQ